MDSILKIAIVVGLLIIIFTGLFVYFKIRSINKEEIDNNDDIVNDNSGNIENINNDIKEVKEDIKVKEEVIENKIEDDKCIDNKVDIDIKEDTTTNSSGKLYSNKFTTTSSLISPVGYYSGNLVRNNLIEKRASKQEVSKIEEKNIDNKVNKVSFGDISKNITKNNTSINYMKELTDKIAKEIKPQTITLTDYEQKQEDEAIISYQELLANKDKMFNISDEEEDEDFINSLKSFRENLD